MSRRDDSLRLQDMLTAARDARLFASGRCQADLIHDKQLRLAILKCIEIIGEAASRVGDETASLYPDLPWADMIGMRNRLVHTYFDVDLNLLWVTVCEDIPPLIQTLERVTGTRLS